MQNMSTLGVEQFPSRTSNNNLYQLDESFNKNKPKQTKSDKISQQNKTNENFSAKNK